ncbi:CdaR family protein [Acanthopleuribacter pedis]|uniref:YbbR-like domain-containing protein n=1 Tax=Acanthopleuribacter pedis TaxID=442870 RepID=A0A8J7U2U6_9BACT|nr:CdaR family protein [Acanthopleuribacter pedis]MBO1319683.1 YbbR-like domain-containing protein [Acanthopleuribacter pedis]
MDKNRDSSFASRSMQKLTALVLALVMWISMSGRQDEAATITAKNFGPPVPLRTLSPDNMRTSLGNYQFSVGLRGKQKVLNELNPQDLLVELDMQGIAAEGKHTIAVSARDVKFPPNIDPPQVVSIVPNFVEVTFTEVVSKELRLLENIKGTPAGDYYIESVELSPSHLTLEGPPKHLNPLQFLTIKAIDVEGATKSMKGTIALDLLPKDSVITGDLSNYTYTIVIRERTEVKNFDQPFPIQVVGSPDYVADPGSVTLQISGPVSVVNWFEPSWIQPEVTVSRPAQSAPDPPQNEQGSDNGAAEPTPTEPSDTAEDPGLTLQITHRWVLPEEKKTESPNWLNRLSRLKIEWQPEDARVILKEAPPPESSQVVDETQNGG